MANDNSLNNPAPNFYRASAADFKKIPGSPIAYWVSEKVRSIFVDGDKLSEYGIPLRTLQTGNKDKYIRYWYEVPTENFTKKIISANEAIISSKKWYAFHNGGAFRRWYGNLDYVVNWQYNGRDIKASGKAIIPNEDKYFSNFVTWSRVSSNKPSFRYQPIGVIPGDIGPCLVSDNYLFSLLGLLNSVFVDYIGNDGRDGTCPVELAEDPAGVGLQRG